MGEGSRSKTSFEDTKQGLYNGLIPGMKRDEILWATTCNATKVGEWGGGGGFQISVPTYSMANYGEKYIKRGCKTCVFMRYFSNVSGHNAKEIGFGNVESGIVSPSPSWPNGI